MLVSYRFNGFLDDVYATLVVKLHHVKPFQSDVLWRYAADFKTLTTKQLGVKLNRRAEGTGELAVYFDPTIPIEEKIVFSKYVHEHLLQKARDVVRLRHYADFVWADFAEIGNGRATLARPCGRTSPTSGVLAAYVSFLWRGVWRDCFRIRFGVRCVDDLG